MKKYFTNKIFNKSTVKDGQPSGSDATLVSTLSAQHAVYAGQRSLSSSNLSQQSPLSQPLRNSSKDDTNHKSFDAYVIPPPSSSSVPPSPHYGSQTHVLPPNKQMRDPREYAERREKNPFWHQDSNKGDDRGGGKFARERGRIFQRKDLASVIGYLTGSASENWELVRQVCDRASANEANAKEAVKTLRREFKYGEPANQLSAARLWGIMLRNCSDIFILQSATREFLDTIEDLLMNPKTYLVVQERILDVIAATAYASGLRLKKGTRPDFGGFRELWRRVKPIDKPDEGVPFAPDDVVFNPLMSSRASQYGGDPFIPRDPQPLIIDMVPVSPPPWKSPRINQIIPHDEDVRRLLQECKIGQGNASLLSQVLLDARPETFKKNPIIREFSQKCRSSQELIFAQIPWATAEAEKSILTRDAKVRSKELDGDVQETTKEQHLLDAILTANGELLKVLNQYDDMIRVARERKVEYQRKKEHNMNTREPSEFQEQIHNLIQPTTRPASRSPPSSLRSASPRQSLHEPRRPHSDAVTGTLGPPPSAPRSPGSPEQISTLPRTPSATSTLVEVGERNFTYHLNSSYNVVDTGGAPALRRAKAPGKQKTAEAEQSDSHAQPRGEIYFDASPNRRNSNGFDDSDNEEHSEPPWHRPIDYVYDAATERAA